MPGPAWNEDQPADTGLIAANIAVLIGSFRTTAAARSVPDVTQVLTWHSAIYAGCALPIAGYSGHFRGDVTVPELVGYEVRVGPKQGIWSVDVPTAVLTFLGQLSSAVSTLDAVLPVGVRPTTVAELDAVIRLTAAVHGEWIRIHPFANGNGRTARLWAAWLAFRYSLPLFVEVKPRPNDAAYAQASFASMGRPPDFTGDHSAAANVFTHLLSLSLLS